MIIFPKTHTFSERKVSQMSGHVKITSGACNEAQWLKAFVTKTEALSLNPRTHIVEGEKVLLRNTKTCGNPALITYITQI